MLANAKPANLDLLLRAVGEAMTAETMAQGLPALHIAVRQAIIRTVNDNKIIMLRETTEK